MQQTIWSHFDKYRYLFTLISPDLSLVEAHKFGSTEVELVQFVVMSGTQWELQEKEAGCGTRVGYRHDT